MLLISVGVLMVVSGINMWWQEVQRSMTPEAISGTLVGLRTVSQVRNETQHFQIASDNGQLSGDLYTEEPLMFMKAQDGQRVEATIIRETGYVSKLRIIAGAHAGFSYDEPKQRNVFGAVAMCVLGFVMLACSIFGSVSDR